ncbi:MAG: sensor histidine kinase KdpD [Planctomycetota bacterium]|nr:sensor histidine kinase KdpD [Planctomycetota bacterium]
MTHKMAPEETNPNPQATDEVLDRFKREQRAAVDGAPVAGSAQPRGRLKIFFGMAPGVGKTYAMLAAAQRMAAQGVDVAVGVVETHGRAETEQMLLGLDIIPRVKIEYQGSGGGGAALHEFDVDAAMRRRPDILLVDELAHSNAPGSPSGRAKRWMDVEACLAAGVNVYTTLNVQHLESINDVVAQITGVKVGETVPDRVFDEADEIELVDLPPDALHERLRAGKVYLGENAVRAVDPSDGFFRKGNLLALRELALRRTAAWVDSDLRRYKQDRGIRAVWPAGERIVVAVSPSPMSAKLIRAAKRMAAGLHADLIAVYVETPRTANLSAANRERLDANLRLAESLGATTQTLAGDNAARELIAFARSRNVGRVVVGKTARARWKEFLFGSFIDNLIRESGDIDIYVVRGDETTPAVARSAQSPAASSDRAAKSPARVAGELAASAGVVLVCALVGLALYRPPDLSEEALVLLAGVLVSALWFGRVAAIFASVLSVLAFNYFFTEPRFTLNINDTGYLVTFCVMLAVGVVVGTLAARAREQRLRAWSRERATAAQHALSRELAAARDTRGVAAIIARHAHDLLQADAVVCTPIPLARDGASLKTTGLDVAAAAGQGGPDWYSGEGEEQARERGVAQWAFDHGNPAGRGTSTLPSAQGRYVPLIGSGGRVGVLGVRAQRKNGAAPFDSAQLATLDSIASQAASALERVTLAESEQSARINAERERLRSALLSSVSHDLRTPLASITGAASTLQQADASRKSEGVDDVEGVGGGIDEPTRAALLRTIVDESSRLNDIIANLVFATRLESGSVDLRREWTTVEEIVGAGLSRHRDALATRPFRVHAPTDLPMIRVDNAMLPQVVHNLVENALRYTAPGTPLGISAWTSETNVVVKVWDEGAGLAEDESSKVFERFYRGRASKAAGSNSHAAASTGMGLGLTICEGIVRVHGGRIWAEPNTPKGVAFLFSLPVEHPQPALPAKEDAAENRGMANVSRTTDAGLIQRSAS